MTEPPGDDRPVGDPTPDDTWERLQRLYGDDAGPRPEEPANAPEEPPEQHSSDPPLAQPPRQYFVDGPATPGPAPAAPPARAASARAAYKASSQTSGGGLPPNALGTAAAGSFARSGSRPGGGAGAPRVATPGPAAPTTDAGSGGGRRRRGWLRWIPHPKAKWFRPKLRWVFLYFPLLLVLLVVAALLFAWSKFGHLDRLDLGDSLRASSGSAVNYLIVGSDSRQGIDPEVDNIDAIGTNVAGHRSDTIIVMRVDGGKASMMSIPRDLWATNAKTGKKGRINGTYNDSPANLVRSVTLNLGIPINHYVEVDFVTFSNMVDATGGVTIHFDNPAYDTHSGLKVTQSGDVRLNGSQALAFVRSRHYTETINGKPKTDPLADIGRQKRQQEFIRAVLHEVGSTRNPWTLAKIAGAAADGMRIDNKLGFGDALSLARSLGGSTLTSVVLPTHDARKGAAAVRELDAGPDAQKVLAGFGGGTG